MDMFGWFWLVVFFTWRFGVSADVMGRKFLSDLHGASPVLLETGFWDIVLYVWAIYAIIAILAISMARSKNTGKGKAPSSSMAHKWINTQDLIKSNGHWRYIQWVLFYKIKRFCLEKGSLGETPMTSFHIWHMNV